MPIKKQIGFSLLTCALISCNDSTSPSETLVSSNDTQSNTSSEKLSSTMGLSNGNSSAVSLSSQIKLSSQEVLSSGLTPSSNSSLSSITNTQTRPDGWEYESHDKSASANYALVFPDNKVNRIDLTIPSENWQAMLDDMTDRYGEFRARTWPTPPPSALSPAPDLSLSSNPENPVYASTTVKFNGKTWEKVGIRFKGNATLSGSWNGGSYKLPFKLDFDEFEDKYPQIDNQRFYGVKSMAMFNHNADEPAIKEKLSADLYRDFGVPVSHHGYYEVYIDFGQGSQYFGLYTGIEIPGGELMKKSFGSSNGNIYKPEPPIGQGEDLRDAAKFKKDAILTETTFQKKSNEDQADWGDIETLISTLHSADRLSNPSLWRSNLEAVFNVNGFLKYLVVNTAIMSSDSYGGAPHNYYIYNHNGQLQWLPYDLNFTYSLMNWNREVDQSDITSDWPLIRHIMDDATYNKAYWQYMDQFLSDHFNQSKLSSKMENLRSLVTASVLKEEQDYTLFYPDFTWFDTKYTEMKNDISSYLPTLQGETLKNAP